MTPRTKTKWLLAGGFLVMIALIVVLGIGAIRVTNTLAGLTTQMYRHPLIVSNAVLEANADIIAMHRHMKDVALARNAADLELAISRVDENEKEVFKHFDVVMDRFLGDKSKIEAARQTFSGWKDIRSEVIELTRAGEHERAAAITKGNTGHRRALGTTYP